MTISVKLENQVEEKEFMFRHTAGQANGFKTYFDATSRE
jgi:hypothetical protein